MAVRLVQFLALVFTGVALAPGLAHLFSMSVKMRASQSDYFVMQQTYNGWALLGLALFGTVFATIAAAWLTRADRTTMLLYAGAAALMIVNLAIFFGWTFPANQATANWTSVPANWEVLRRNWEVSHAVNAGITFVAFSFVSGAALRA